mmetsp:Transcript_60136/g.158889  ORF Transcript_60136/g.158889 Transcript_60136/m.158889 type:complete len:211 (+) Transcript_60136:923-1555(+)
MFNLGLMRTDFTITSRATAPSLEVRSWSPSVSAPNLIKHGGSGQSSSSTAIPLFCSFNICSTARVTCAVIRTFLGRTLFGDGWIELGLVGSSARTGHSGVQAQPREALPCWWHQGLRRGTIATAHLAMLELHGDGVDPVTVHRRVGLLLQPEAERLIQLDGALGPLPPDVLSGILRRPIHLHDKLDVRHTVAHGGEDEPTEVPVLARLAG